MGDNSIKLTTEQLKAILCYASRDVTRVHLAGVHVTPDHLVATDGHRLIAVPTSYAGTYNGPAFTVPSDAITLACKSAGPKGTVEIVREPGGTEIKLISRTKAGKYGAPGTEAHWHAKAITVPFPPYQQVIPRDGKFTGGVSLNPSYMADLEPVADAFATGGEASVELTSGGGNAHLDPVLFRIGAKRDIRVVIMPVRAATYAQLNRAATPAATESTEPAAIAA